MNRKQALGGFLTAAALLLCLAAPASASYADLPSNHWAYEQMGRAVGLGIINGVGGNRMDPQGTLTWAQFLTMMGRTFATESYRAASQELPWDQAGYRAALESGMLLPNDFLPVTAETLGEPITRQDTAVLLSRVIPESAKRPTYYWYDWDDEDAPTAPREAWEVLSDFYSMDSDHQSAASRLYELEVILGKDDGTFGPQDTLRRADGTVLLMRTLGIVDRERYGDDMTLEIRFTDRSGAEVAPAQSVDGYVGQDLYWLAYQSAPENYKPHDHSGSVSSACSNYTFVYRPMTQAEIEEHVASEKLSSGEMTYEEYLAQDFWLRFPGENERKHMLLFGDAEKRRFENRAEAEANMATIEIPMWRLTKKGKVASKGTFQVHAAIAEDVKAIFTEIYNDPEQFPIADMGGYGWRGDSATGEHNCGTAIDINPTQNYQVRDGQAMVGSFWKPGESPYSLSPEGSVVRIFKEHGWSWGGDAWAWSTDPTEGYHDYMHFSYMGG